MQETSRGKNPGEDRRQDPRIKVQVWVKEKGDDYTCFHLISNLSRNGLFIDKKLPFSIGSVLNLELELAGSDQLKTDLKGLVVNNYYGSDLDVTGTGVKFIEMSPADRQKIETYLGQIESK